MIEASKTKKLSGEINLLDLLCVEYPDTLLIQNLLLILSQMYEINLNCQILSQVLKMPQWDKSFLTYT